MAMASRKAGRPLLLLSPSWSLAGAFVWVIRLGHRRGGKLRSFLSSAIAPNTFLREVPLRVSVRGSARSWQTLIYLVRIPLRKGHSIQLDVRLAWKSS